MDLLQDFKNINKNDVSIAGGKGASLGEMTQAGIPVPPGFVILSNAFEKFLEETDINVEIDSILDSVNHKEMHTVEDASEKIKALILQAEMPKDIVAEIQKFFKKLNSKYVAVRSSATAEDSASAAWAGQLESYLNTTKENLLENVKKCWASLFTPRAIFYRFEKDLHKQKISVAVVIQKMIESKKSGIAFSVHPVTQDRNQLIIEAGFGLGEAIVSGQITPDSYVVEKQPRRIIDRNVQTQSRGLYRAESEGNEWREIPKELGGKQVLSDKEILELSEIILQIEKHYNFPCDIEWAVERENFYIVQSRPITTLREGSVGAREKYMELSYERVFGGPNMPFLVSDFAAEKYVYRYHFVITKIDNIWTCYMPLKEKQRTLAEGKKLYSSAVAYKKYKSGYLKFIDDYPQKFDSIIANNDSVVAEDFNHFIDLCWGAETYYENTQYFFTDLVVADKELEQDFSNLKIKGRALLNNQYFSANNYLERVLKKVSIVTGIDLPNLYFYKWKELADLLKGKKVETPDKVVRLTFITYLDDNDKVTLIGEDAREKIIAFQNKHEKQQVGLSGTIANKGKVIGAVRILDQGYEHKNLSKFLDDMRKGEILVAETTSPEIIVACQKAAAIITNQGGLMSHAAIVSRELGIPCIVGVEGATAKLKNGDVVEVDANLGIVQILKK